MVGTARLCWLQQLLCQHQRSQAVGSVRGIGIHEYLRKRSTGYSHQYPGLPRKQEMAVVAAYAIEMCVER